MDSGWGDRCCQSGAPGPCKFGSFHWAHHLVWLLNLHLDTVSSVATLGMQGRLQQNEQSVQATRKQKALCQEEKGAFARRMR